MKKNNLSLVIFLAVLSSISASFAVNEPGNGLSQSISDFEKYQDEDLDSKITAVFKFFKMNPDLSIKIKNIIKTEISKYISASILKNTEEAQSALNGLETKVLSWGAKLKQQDTYKASVGELIQSVKTYTAKFLEVYEKNSCGTKYWNDNMLINCVISQYGELLKLKYDENFKQNFKPESIHRIKIDLYPYIIKNGMDKTLRIMRTMITQHLIEANKNTGIASDIFTHLSNRDMLTQMLKDAIENTQDARNLAHEKRVLRRKRTIENELESPQNEENLESAKTILLTMLLDLLDQNSDLSDEITESDMLDDMESDFPKMVLQSIYAEKFECPSDKTEECKTAMEDLQKTWRDHLNKKYITFFKTEENLNIFLDEFKQKITDLVNNNKSIDVKFEEQQSASSCSLEKIKETQENLNVIADVEQEIKNKKEEINEKKNEIKQEEKIIKNVEKKIDLEKTVVLEELEESCSADSENQQIQNNEDQKKRDDEENNTEILSTLSTQSEIEDNQSNEERQSDQNNENQEESIKTMHSFWDDETWFDIVGREKELTEDEKEYFKNNLRQMALKLFMEKAGIGLEKNDDAESSLKNAIQNATTRNNKRLNEPAVNKAMEWIKYFDNVLSSDFETIFPADHDGCSAAFRKAILIQIRSDGNYDDIYKRYAGLLKKLDRYSIRKNLPDYINQQKIGYKSKQRYELILGFENFVNTRNLTINSNRPEESDLFVFLLIYFNFIKEPGKCSQY